MLATAPAIAQSVTVEADVSAGSSTENVRAAAAQVRLFGATASDWRVFAEASWADTWGQRTDAFNAAYPYDGGIRPIEAYVEKMFRPANRLLGFRAGQYRTPFGISGRGDHAYTGFTRAPLIRYGREFALSNTFFEAGADVIAGMPQAYGEISIGAPRDEGEIKRRRELDVVIRGQAYYKSFVVGASRMHSGRDKSLASFAQGRSVFNGVDARWTARGVQLRGEYIIGHPFDGVSTDGGYVDLIVHRVGMGPVTAVARAEKLDYDAGPFSFYRKRVSAGARIRFAEYLSGQINLIREPHGLAANRSVALDVGLTCTIRR